MQRVISPWILAPLFAAGCGGGAPSSQQCSPLEAASAPGTPPVPQEPPVTPPPVTPPPAGPSVDAFGVTMLYPSVAGGESWTMPSDPRSDPRFDPQNPIAPNPDGSWKMQSSK